MNPTNTAARALDRLLTSCKDTSHLRREIRPLKQTMKVPLDRRPPWDIRVINLGFGVCGERPQAPSAATLGRYAMVISSGTLNAGQMLVELDEIATQFRGAGVAQVVAMFGWGTRLPVDELWIERCVAVEDLRGYVQANIDAGVFVPGDSDLVIRDSASAVEYLLCHESDIHLTTGDKAILAQTIQRWSDRGYQAWKSVPGGAWEKL